MLVKLTRMVLVDGVAQHMQWSGAIHERPFPQLTLHFPNFSHYCSSVHYDVAERFWTAVDNSNVYPVDELQLKALLLTGWRFV